MPTAMVFSAGGYYAAWEVGVWNALRTRIPVDMVAGASAGAWNAWWVAGGATPEQLAAEWLDPLTARLMQPGLHSSGLLRREALDAKAQELASRFKPRIPYGLTVVELPGLTVRLVRGEQVTWRHLAATCAIPFGFAPVQIDGKLYVDGGVKGGLPLWAAEQMGAHRAIGLNVLTAAPFRMLRRMLPPPRPAPGFETIVIEPSQRLGSVRHAVRWDADRIRRWMELGERDGIQAMTSITM
jgi:predicted acylesterase/phospholipase RssA